MRAGALILSFALILAVGCGRMGDPIPPGQSRVGTPQGLVVQGREGGLTIGWSLPTRTLAGAGGEIWGFLVERAEAEKGKEDCESCGGEFCEVAEVHASEGLAVYSWTDSGAEPSRTYRYRVLALDDRKNPGSPSAPVAATYYRIPAPKVELLPIGGGAVVKYSLADAAQNYEGINAYDGEGRFLALLGGDKTEGRLAGLKDGAPVELFFRASVISPQGWRIESEALALSVTPKDTEPPQPPADLALFGEPGGVRVMWMAPPGEPYHAVSVFRGTNPGSLEKIAAVPGNQTFYFDSAAAPGVTYYYGCTGSDAAGNESPLSEVKPASSARKQEEGANPAR